MAALGRKTRKQDDPYLTVKLGRWTWKLLKFYRNDGSTPFARVLCAVNSPATYGGYDVGDTYIDDIRSVLARGAGWTLADDVDHETITQLLGIKELP